ncbi:MAG: TVP38/TMEM64 family protein [Candidatus Omnitrophica bacterium]|nr:TVP38/TMEM64 family protein [Candidatus Omnitrophota bacterium]MCB9720392.1 TVP38/TMEM64 family protein [Candidatus Omnitrophota bacterium]
MTAGKLIARLRGPDDINLKCLGAGLIVLGVYLFSKYLQDSELVRQFFENIRSLGWWAPVLYVVLYIVMSGVILPSAVFKVFAGTVFGVFQGVLVASLAACISSYIKFLLARYFFRDTINKKIQANPKWKRLDLLIEKEGWKILMLLRNIPVGNALFLNYVCGVTKMPSRDFVVASFVGRLPQTFVYVYLGYLVGYTSGIDGTNPTRVTFEWILLWMGLLATVGVTYYVVYISKKLLEDAVPEAGLTLEP